MKHVYDLTGMRYGRLVAVEQRGFDNHGRAVWLWRCDCGTEKELQAYVVRNGHAKSCGCLLKDNKTGLIHGGYGTRLYKTWSTMKARCNNKNMPEHRWYGARGISVCEGWNDFSTFREWALANGYADNLTIERIDVNGNYEPDNCTWILLEEQGRNKTNTVYFKINGITKPLMDWADEYGVPRSTVYVRYTRGKYPFRDNEIDKSIMDKRRLRKL